MKKMTKNKIAIASRLFDEISDAADRAVAHYQKVFKNHGIPNWKCLWDSASVVQINPNSVEMLMTYCNNRFTIPADALADADMEEVVGRIAKGDIDEISAEETNRQASIEAREKAEFERLRKKFEETVK